MKKEKTMKSSSLYTIETPIISLTMSVIREHLRQEILANKLSSKESTNDEGDKDSSLSYCDLATELAKIQEILPQQYEISGLELLQNCSIDDDSECHTFDEDDYSYDSSQINSIVLSHIRIENKVQVNENKKISDNSSICSTNIQGSEASISSNIDHDVSTRRDRIMSIGSYAGNSIEVARNKNLTASQLYTQRRLSVYSDHTNESDDDEENIEHSRNIVLKQYHTFEVPLQPLHSDNTTSYIDRRKQFQMSYSSDSSVSESNTLSSSYANDSFRKQITAIASSKNSLGSKTYDDTRRSITSISAEMIDMDRTGCANRAA
jgi:hypothetical protein